MSKETVIRLKNVSKTFYIDEGIATSIRDFSKSIFRIKRKGERKVIKAVDDVNIEIEKGEFFGIVGRNGSGKSTLLNMMIGAIRPDKGCVIETKGKMVRLALGMGFDPNLTARDNIYVNASILGLTFKRIGLIFDDIIGFAELEDFVDFPVKNFSSGMISKLKFSIAIHAKADIFLMDEFFGGVGDESFKKKSSEVFQNTFLDGRTIIHVSHQLGTIKKHCKRVLLIDGGKQLMVDTPEVVIPAYKSLFAKEKAKLKEDKGESNKIVIEKTDVKKAEASAKKAKATKAPTPKTATTKTPVTKPLITKSVATKPAVAKPAVTKLAAKKSEVTKPAAKKSATTKPKATKSAAPKPVATKPVTKPAPRETTATNHPVTKKAVTKEAVAKKSIVMKPLASQAPVIKKTIDKSGSSKLPETANDPLSKLPLDKDSVSLDSSKKKLDKDSTDSSSEV